MNSLTVPRIEETSPESGSPGAPEPLQEYRRGHKKSRKGCNTCKQRHIKCDESHPACSNCRIAERVCRYEPPQPRKPARRRSRYEVAASSLSSEVTSSAPSPVPPRSPNPPTSSRSPVPNPDRDATAPPPPAPLAPTPAPSEPDTEVNMLHMELLANFSNETFVPAMGGDFPDARHMMMRTALEVPYVMYELLAMSARHLSVFCAPHKKPTYRHQAMHLQTRALSLFNAATHDSADTHGKPFLARVVFFSLLGRHLLADALACRDPDLGVFLNGYAHSVQIHRTAMGLIRDNWLQLMGTDLEPAVTWGMAVKGKLEGIAQRNDCGVLVGLLSARMRDGWLAQDELEACTAAVGHLQEAFDATRWLGESVPNCNFIFIWTIQVPQTFMDMLGARRPEALAIFGWYALLLDCWQDVWQIGDAGQYLLQTVPAFLGPAWDEWLAWPMVVIRSGGLMRT